MRGTRPGKTGDKKQTHGLWATNTQHLDGPFLWTWSTHLRKQSPRSSPKHRSAIHHCSSALQCWGGSGCASLHALNQSPGVPWETAGTSHHIPVSCMDKTPCQVWVPPPCRVHQQPLPSQMSCRSFCPTIRPATHSFNGMLQKQTNKIKPQNKPKHPEGQ